ncbi:Zinc finger and BTB domain-containing protein [Heracleum sosnowskyi]|uniref:Zinc finger and BTB domain-containing protein n=1 Tax=Heracleum sosnowskyi TaxID=360622 RepID=A0AAD8GTC4_9APIA|nr:Zinc finger and BTB domain-containing protein [Heracleum sosnowskyi]
MRRILVAMRENLQNKRKSPRVADENMFGDNGNVAGLPILAQNNDRPRHGWNGFTVICSIVRAPLSLLSCLSHPHINSADGVWVSGEFGRISEMNHLMVNDSMRYAILM